MPTSNSKGNRSLRPGPKAERVKIEGDWEDAIDQALDKKRPKEGWPKPDKAEKPDSEPESDD